MHILSYSERGIVNALFYEIRYSSDPEALLADLLSRVRFPFTDAPSLSISDAKVLIEQSFSDFGTADALLLLTTDMGNISVFVEAKVGATWSIQKEFEGFVEGTSTEVSSSNLFTQLYHKVRLVDALCQRGIAGLQEGTVFPQSSTKRLRKIGTNSVVLRAVEMLAEHRDETYYVALVPDKPDELMRFFENLPERSPPADFVEWDVRNYGYLSWLSARDLCDDNDLTNAQEVFRFNAGQIHS